MDPLQLMREVDAEPDPTSSRSDSPLAGAGTEWLECRAENGVVAHDGCGVARPPWVAYLPPLSRRPSSSLASRLPLSSSLRRPPRWRC